MSGASYMEADVIAELGAATANPIDRTEAGEAAYTVTPDGWRIQDLEQFNAAPRRTRRTVRVHDVDSFARYWSPFQTAASLIFGDSAERAIVGVLDYDTPASPDWAQHRVQLKLSLSVEYARWREIHGRMMSQADFARFIEENILDIRQPAGADVLEIARHLEVNSKVAWRSSIRLQDGSRQFSYAETSEAALTASGTIVVPERFVIGVPVFDGGAHYAIEALLRYRLNDGRLQMGVELHRHELVERGAFDDVLVDIKTRTGVEPLKGSI